MLAQPTARHHANNPASNLQSPLLPITQNNPSADAIDLSAAEQRRMAKVTSGAKKVGLGFLSTCGSTAAGMFVGHGLGLWEGYSEAGLRRLSPEHVPSLVAARGIAGLTLGAAAFGLVGLSWGVSGQRAMGHVTRRLASVVSGALGALPAALMLGYIGATAGAIICESTAVAVGAVPQSMARMGWDAGAWAGTAAGALVGGGAGLSALLPYRSVAPASAVDAGAQ